MTAFPAGLLACLLVPAQDGRDREVDALIRVLGHPEAAGENLPESTKAIRRLASLGGRAAPQLIDAVLRHPNTHQGAYSRLALEEMGKEAFPALRGRWPKLDRADRWKLARLLVRCDRPAAEAFAVESLKDKSHNVRRQAWEFIIRHKVAAARDAYLQALAGGEAAELRWGLISETVVFDAEAEADILTALLAPASWVAKGEGHPRRECEEPPWHPDERPQIIAALKARQAKRAGPALLRVLQEKGASRAYLGCYVIPLLGEFGCKEAIPELKSLLTVKPGADMAADLNSVEERRAQAARALWQLGDRSGRNLLLKGLKDKHWGERRYAAEAVAAFGDRRDIDVLAGVLDDPDWGVRRAACRGLERITGEVNRARGWVDSSEYDAPLWKEWYRKNRKAGA